MKEPERSQILQIRSGGKYNMFSIREVQREAFDLGFYELVCLIEDNPGEYVHFILYGDGGDCDGHD